MSLSVPVSFSIKPKDEPAVPLRPVLPQEPSSDEDEKAEKKECTENDSQLQSKVPLSPIRIVPEPPIISSPLPQPPKIGSIVLKPTSKPTPTPENRLSAPFEDLSDTAIRDSIFEPSIEEKKEAKRADDKVRDRLAQIAREKLGILSKEKQVQIERKKRAMAFLNNIKGKNIA